MTGGAAPACPAAAPQAFTTAVLMLIFDEVELLDFAGPYEVFTMATRVHARQSPRDTPPLFSVHTASRDGRPVRARAGLTLQADHDLAHAPATPWQSGGPA